MQPCLCCGSSCCSSRCSTGEGCGQAATAVARARIFISAWGHKLCAQTEASPTSLEADAARGRSIVAPLAAAPTVRLYAPQRCMRVHACLRPGTTSAPYFPTPSTLNSAFPAPPEPTHAGARCAAWWRAHRAPTTRSCWPTRTCSCVRCWSWAASSWRGCEPPRDQLSAPLGHAASQQKRQQQCRAGRRRGRGSRPGVGASWWHPRATAQSPWHICGNCFHAFCQAWWRAMSGNAHGQFMSVQLTREERGNI